MRVKIPEHMRRFLGIYHVTRPELEKNGFVTKYLNYCIQSFCQVFGKYSSTMADLELCADNFRVDIDTPHFRRTENVLKSELNAKIDKLIETQSTSVPGGRGGKTGKSSNVVSSSESKPERLCFRFYTTQGCSYPNCSFMHKLKPAAAQVKKIKEQLARSNTRFPSSPAFVVDESKV